LSDVDREESAELHEQANSTSETSAVIQAVAALDPSVPEEGVTNNVDGGCVL